MIFFQIQEDRDIHSHGLHLHHNTSRIFFISGINDFENVGRVLSSGS
jgi:hypothetical protein